METVWRARMREIAAPDKDDESLDRDRAQLHVEQHKGGLDRRRGKRYILAPDNATKERSVRRLDRKRILNHLAKVKKL